MKPPQLQKESVAKLRERWRPIVDQESSYLSYYSLCNSISSILVITSQKQIEIRSRFYKSMCRCGWRVRPSDRMKAAFLRSKPSTNMHYHYLNATSTLDCVQYISKSFTINAVVLLMIKNTLYLNSFSKQYVGD